MQQAPNTKGLELPSLQIRILSDIDKNLKLACFSQEPAREVPTGQSGLFNGIEDIQPGNILRNSGRFSCCCLHDLSQLVEWQF
jgi:hypothetical protein